MRACKLFALPSELILEIAKYASRSSLSAWARTCWRAYNILNLSLYSIPLNRIQSALHCTSQQNQTGSIQLMLDINWPNIKQTGFAHSILELACSHGYTDIVRWLLKHGCPPDRGEKVDDYFKGFYSAFCCAARGLHFDIVDMLIAAGTNDMKYSLSQVHIFFHSATEPMFEMASRLIQLGVDIKAREDNGNTLLHEIYQSENASAIISFLLDQGLDIDSRNNRGYTPLMMAADFPSRIFDTARVVDMLLHRGASINLTNIHDGWSALHYAAMNATPNTVQRLLDMGADIDGSDPTGRTPLYLAVEGGRDAVVKVLLDAGANPAALIEMPRAEVWTPLHAALQFWRSLCIQYLLQAWVKRPPRIRMPQLLLVAAAWVGDVAMVKELLSSGNVDADRMLLNKTALMAAAISGHEECIWLLLPHVQHPNKRNRQGYTALHLAMRHSTESTIRLLMKVSSYSSSPSSDGMTLLADAITYQSVELTSSLLDWRPKSAPTEMWHLAAEAARNRPEMIGLLLKHMVLDRRQPDEEFIPLVFAIEYGYIDTALCLIKDEIVLDAKDTTEHTALTMAAQKGHLEVVKALVAKGVSLETPSSSGLWNPLALALENNHYEVVQYLLSAGANVSVLEQHSHPSKLLGDASDHKKIDIALSLFAAGVDVDWPDAKLQRSPLSWAVKTANFYYVRFFLARGAQVNRMDNEGHTALSLAAKGGHEAIIPDLLDAGAQIDTQYPSQGRAALSWAADRGQYNIVKLLIDAGATIDIADRFGRTPFLTAVCRGHIKIAKFLLRAGADMRCTDFLRRSALSLCADQGHTAILAWLIGQRIDLNSVDHRGRTALSWAMQKDQREAVRLLVCAGCDRTKADKSGQTPLHWAGSDEVVGDLYTSFLSGESSEIPGFISSLLDV